MPEILSGRGGLRNEALEKHFGDEVRSPRFH